MKDLKGMDVRLESKALPDGRGGLFINGELIETFDTEAESDSAGLAYVRSLVVLGIAEQNGQAYKDDKPIDLFDMSVR
jgi:hypothetical protein